MPSLAALPFLLASLSATSANEVAAGELVPPLQFRTLLGGDGRMKLEDYRGSPVLFAWYSTVGAGMNAAQGALDLAEEQADLDLAVILMEIKNNDAVFLRALQMKALPGARCALLKNQNLPFAYDDSTGPPPKVALVGVDGTLLYAGSYQGLRNCKKLLSAEAKKREQGWGEHGAAKAARASAYGEGKLGAARAALQAALTSEPGEAELAAVAAELDARFASWKGSIGYLKEHGEFLRARDAAAALVAAAAGEATWLAEAQELAVWFDTPEAEAAIELEQKLVKLLKPLETKAPKPGIAQRLRSFADDAGDSPLAARARELADAADYALEELKL